MESVYGTDYSKNEYCEEPAETADAGVTSGNGLEAQVENGRKTDPNGFSFFADKRFVLYSIA